MIFFSEIGQFFGYKVSDPNGQVVGCLPDLVRGYRYGHTAHRIVMMGRYSNSEKCISLIAHSDEGFRQTVKTQNTKKDNQKEKREARVENVGVGSCKQEIQLTIRRASSDDRGLARETYQRKEK